MSVHFLLPGIAFPHLRRSGAVLFALLWVAAAPGPVQAAGPETAAGVRVEGPGEAPHLFFACCDQGMAAAQKLFADRAVMTGLQALHAGLAVAVPDASAERAQLVQRLNAAGIPVVAWIELPCDGTYINAGDVPQTKAAVAAFEQWSDRYGLHWQGVGLDIEPNFSELGRLRGHPWRMVRLLASRYVDRARVFRARSSYAELIRQLHARGYRVQTYQLPFIVAEREEHSTLIERLLGVVDVRGDEEAIMLYTSMVPEVGAGIIRVLGPDAQAIAIGSTMGDPSAGPRGRPLDWDTFSRDLLVAAHFTRTVGVYDLEGCVQQGFLERLRSMDWHPSVVIPAAKVRRAQQRAGAVRAIVRIGTWLPAIAAVGILWLVAAFWLWRAHRRLVRLRLESRR